MKTALLCNIWTSLRFPHGIFFFFSLSFLVVTFFFFFSFSPSLEVSLSILATLG